MHVVGSIVKEQGIDFAVVQVHAFKVGNAQEAEETIRNYSKFFPGMPVVLMAVGGEAGTTYWGRTDLANFMARQRPSAVTWQKFTFARA
jgi:hypothetical protein